MLYEDAMFLSAYALKAKSMRITGDADYDYFIRAGGKMVVENRLRRTANQFDLRDSRRCLDPQMRFWRGSFFLSAMEILCNSGIRPSLRYMRWKSLD